MKKLLILLIALLLPLSAALAEQTLVDPYADFSVESAMSEYLAAQLSEALGENFSVRHEADTADAVNAFLAMDGGSAVLICTQDAMILSLQGYTDDDLRTALQPVTNVAQSDSFFYAAPAAAEIIGSMTKEELIAYTEENAYELYLARLVDASHTDYLTLEAGAEMYVDQNLYLDFDEAAQAAEDGEMDLAVFSGAMTPAAARAYTRLFSAELPGLRQGVFVKSDAAVRAPALKEALEEICASDAWQTLLIQGGYASEPCPDPEEFAQETRALFADYVRYLTNEGLFFYEE